jgi:hypothetical protein
VRQHHSSGKPKVATAAKLPGGQQQQQREWPKAIEKKKERN